MPNPPPDSPQGFIEQLLGFARLMSLDDELPDASTPIGRATHEFFANNWAQARDGLLARTTRVRVIPQPSPAPRVFHFEIDTRFKCKRGASALVELAEGPLRGTIRYRADLYTAPAQAPSVMVFIDPDHDLYHPNFSRSHGVLCVGALPLGPFPLEDLLCHLYSILTYQNRSTSDPADLEAAQYFERSPEAMSGLENVEPLYA